MWLIFSCMAIALIQSSLTDNLSSLVLGLCVLIPALLTELLITYGEHGFASLKDGSAAASAMVLALLLPNHLHPVYAVLGGIFAMAVIKHSFGGLGANWVNPAAGSWLFLRLCWPASFERALAGSPLSVISESLSNISNLQGSPMGTLKISGSGTSPWAASAFDQLVSSVLNSSLFSYTRAELPSGYVDLFISKAAGIIGDRGIFALLVGTIIITATQVSRAWVPAVYLAVYGILIRAFGALPFGGLAGGGDVLFGFLTGGTLIAAFILADDPVTGAKSTAGILGLAVLAAVLSWVFRYQGMESYGAFFAVLFVNALTPLVRGLEFRGFYSGKRSLL
jgi:electron transport complex protein RnfD